MQRPDTSLNYGRRLQRVAEHIATNLDASLDLPQLAQFACFSLYHFHRIYRAAMGETAAETLTRLRLARAATDLARTSLSLGDIRRRAGYGSDAAFSRAFSAAYGQPPDAFRKSYRRKLAIPAHPPQGAVAMNVEIQDRPPLRIAAIEHIGPHAEIGHTFQRLAAWAGPRGVLGPTAYGVAVYHEKAACDGLAPDRSALAGLTVAADVAGGDGVTIHEIPGGKHAIALHEGPYAELPRTYDALFTWLAASGEEPADAPLFEVNLNNPSNTPPAELLTEICLPLK
ncbi:GyrI-like domain-containing protein [Phenylobacterium sp.]|uniref:AraC family transcriptional regulator n=1 Tax=Phenylobacterium sp. TaxID=1871053 RepID=UPI0035B34916